jgi:hypothetical protein
MAIHVGHLQVGFEDRRFEGHGSGGGVPSGKNRTLAETRRARAPSGRDAAVRGRVSVRISHTDMLMPKRHNCYARVRAYGARGFLE